MLEREFCTWIGKKLNSIGFYFKISDQDQRSKPFDAFGCFQWIPVALEFKKVDWLIVYPYKELRWSSPKNPWGQVLWLWNWDKNWWLSLVIVYSRKAKRFEVFKFEELHLDYKYVFDEK